MRTNLTIPFVILVTAYIGLALLFSYERLMWDGTHYFFRIIASESYHIQHDRWVNLLSQSVPVLLLHIAGFKTTLYAYSVALGLPFLLAFTAAYFFRDYRGFWLAAVLAFSASAFTYFWAISEIRVALALAVILIVVLRRLPPGYLRTGLLMAAGPIFYYTHPASLGVYGWLCCFMLFFPPEFEHNPGAIFVRAEFRRYKEIALVLAWAVALLVLRFENLDPYESASLGRRGSAGMPAFYVGFLLYFGWLGIIVICVSVLYIVKRRLWALAIFTAGSCLSWIFAVYVVSQGTGPYYIEHLYQACVLYALAPACYALPRDPDDLRAAGPVGQSHRAHLCVLVLVAVVGLARIFWMGADFWKIRGTAAALTSIATAQGLERAVMADSPLVDLIGAQITYLPIYTLIYSTAETGHSVTISSESPRVRHRLALLVDQLAPQSRFFTLSPEPDWRPLFLGEETARSLE